MPADPSRSGPRPILTLLRGVLARLIRYRYRKCCKKRRARRGTNAVVGSHVYEYTAAQCLRCDRGQHRRCARIPGHCVALERSPNGINRRKRGTPRAPRDP